MRADYNKGVAPGLVADGVPAVVANQYSVLDRSATTFAQHFYWCLRRGCRWETRAREGRIALNYSGGGLIDWAVPVLFARDPDAVLRRQRRGTTATARRAASRTRPGIRAAADRDAAAGPIACSGRSGGGNRSQSVSPQAQTFQAAEAR